MQELFLYMTVCATKGWKEQKTPQQMKAGRRRAAFASQSGEGGIVDETKRKLRKWFV